MTAALLLACAVTACGKKGPPLTPIVRVPDAPEIAGGVRVGDDVYVTVQVPQQNIDGSMPASVTRVEVYGATSLTPPPRARFLDIATLVATIPVAPAADPETPDVPVAVTPADAGAVQGSSVTLRDTLSADEIMPRELPLLEEERRRQEQERRRAEQQGLAPAPRPTALRRFYIAIPFGPRGIPGPSTPVLEIPLTVLPDRPTDLGAAMTETAVSLEWAPAGGLVGWLMNSGLPLEQSPVQQVALAPAAGPAATLPTSDLPPGPTLYNVYRQMAPDPLLLPETIAAPTWEVPLPVPVNASPLSTLTYSETILTDERERCYQVRSVRGSGAQRVESEPSNRTCVTPFDIYPPVAPTGLTTVPMEGAITVFWEPNIEDDLGGYIVLRHDPSGATLQLTAAPIAVTRFTDRDVTPGVRYTYEVRAVDSRIPLPNVSPPSQLSETAQ